MLVALKGNVIIISFFLIMKDKTKVAKSVILHAAMGYAFISTLAEDELP